MKRWRCLVFVLLSVLFSGCSWISGINAYSARPTCAVPGATPEREPTAKEMEDQQLVNKDCYYKLVITEKDDQAGWAKGHMPKEEILFNKNQLDLGPFKNAIRRGLEPDNVPLDIHKVQVNNVAQVMVGKVAYFVKDPTSETVTYLSDQEMCVRKENLIQETLDKFYKGKTIDVPDEIRKECPNLKDQYKGKEPKE